MEREGTPTIDAHVHIWSTDAQAYPWAPRDQVAPPAIRAPVERLRAEMGTVGAVGAVAIQPSVYGYDHAYLRAMAGASGGRIVAVCLLNPVHPGAGEQLAGFVTRDGFRGLRVTAIGRSDAGPLVGPEASVLWEQVRRLRVPVSFLIDPVHLGAVETAAESCPDVPIIIDHLARCHPGDRDAHARLVGLARLPNVLVKVSAFDGLSGEAFPYRGMWPLIQACLAAYGPNRLMWGTDFPHVLRYSPYRWSLDALDQAVRWESDRDRNAVTGGTVARIYGLEDLESN